MSNTNSISWPKMFDVARNKVNLYTDNRSVVNRTKLLILTNPTEIYNNPTQGVGLKRYLWQYNNDNIRALIQDRIIAQLRENEPCVDADKTSFSDRLMFSEEQVSHSAQDFNRLKMTVGLSTIYGNVVNFPIDLEDERKAMFGEPVTE